MHDVPSINITNPLSHASWTICFPDSLGLHSGSFRWQTITCKPGVPLIMDVSGMRVDLHPVIGRYAQQYLIILHCYNQAICHWAAWLSHPMYGTALVISSLSCRCWREYICTSNCSIYTSVSRGIKRFSLPRDPVGFWEFEMDILKFVYVVGWMKSCCRSKLSHEKMMRLLICKYL